jgi:hypothetical protein
LISVEGEFEEAALLVKKSLAEKKKPLRKS